MRKHAVEKKIFRRAYAPAIGFLIAAKGLNAVGRHSERRWEPCRHLAHFSLRPVNRRRGGPPQFDQYGGLRAPAESSQFGLDSGTIRGLAEGQKTPRFSGRFR